MENHPKKILSIETSGRTLSLALSEECGGGPRVLGEIRFDVGFRHSEMLSEACRFLVQGAGLKKEDLTHIAVSTGPGSFTGLRVGISYARTLAQFLKIPLIGVPAFEIIAKGAGKNQGPRAKLLCVLIESIGKEVYLGIFKPGSSKPMEPYRVIASDALEKKLASLARKKVLFSSEHVPKARDLGAIALERAGGVSPKAWRKVEPFYLREPIAVERAKVRKGK